MENVIRHFMHYISTNYLFEIFGVSLALVVIIAISRLILRWRRYVSIVNKLPMWKLAFHHILGHVHFTINRRLARKPVLSEHVYDIIILNGYSIPFRNRSFSALWASTFPVISVYRADSVEAILNNSTELEKAWPYRFTHPWLGNGLLTSDGLQWRNRRKLLTPAFHFNILKDFVPVFNKQSKILVDLLKNHITEEFVDVVPFIKKCSFDIICEAILGVNMQSQTSPSCEYLTSVSLITEALFERIYNPLLWPDFIFKMTKLGRNFLVNVKLAHDFIYQLINEKKKQKLSTNASAMVGGDDYATRRKRALLDLLLDEHIKNNALKESDIREEVDTFTFEGHDTTSMGMSWAMYLIGLHPGIQEKIHQELDSIFGDSDRDITTDDLTEMKYLECVLKETLRLYPPVPCFGRELKKDLELEGLLVPGGTTCMVFPYFLHRDPDVFPNPEKFDPERFYPENCIGRHPFAYVPFSAGVRNCIGQRFALMEEKTVIATVLRKFKLRSLDPRDKIHVMNQLVLRPLEKLRIEIRLRDHIPEKPPVFFYYP